MQLKPFIFSAFLFFTSPLLLAQSQDAIQLFEGKWHDISLKDSSSLPEVKVSIQYDQDSLRINAIVKDSHFRDSERGWRYGDGFLFNFTFPGENDSTDTENFYAYGFSLENKKPVAVLVNKDGNYFLSRKEQYSPKIFVDSVKQIAEYFIALPWSALYPFNPLMDLRAGINIIYVSQNDDRSRKILKYIDDPYYDTEISNKRKFAYVDFLPSDLSRLKIVCKPESRLLLDDRTKLNIAIYSPETIFAHFDCIVFDSSKRFATYFYNEKLNPGRNVIKRELEVPEQEGVYYLLVKLDEKNYWSDSFYKLGRNRIPELKSKIAQLEKTGNSGTFQNSISVLNYYADELEKKVYSFNERKDPLEVKQKVWEITKLLNKFKDKGTIYTENGYLLSAFKSEDDSSLQPFSIYLPENFDTSRTYNLLLTLHGSGENEIWAVNSMGKEFAGNNYIVAGPRGRDLSSWYTGKTETDILQLITSIKSIFKINKTIIYGFSMGGYGVWRFCFLHPGLFNAAIVISGIPFNLKDDIPENDIRRSAESAKSIPFLVIHGAEDHSLDIKYTDEFISTLKNNGHDIEYIRIPGAGHGNFKTKDFIKEWLKKKQLLR